MLVSHGYLPCLHTEILCDTRSDLLWGSWACTHRPRTKISQNPATVSCSGLGDKHWFPSLVQLFSRARHLAVLFSSVAPLSSCWGQRYSWQMINLMWYMPGKYWWAMIIHVLKRCRRLKGRHYIYSQWMLNFYEKKFTRCRPYCFEN